MEISNKTVGQIVREDYRAADVFEKYGIDFCCAGKKPLEASCTEKGVEYYEVVNALTGISDSAMPKFDYENMSLTALTDYIENTHHRYIEESGPVIMKYLEKVVTVHGKHNPELAVVQHLFKESLGDLVIHMRKEELVFFPYVRKVEASHGRGAQPKDLASFGSIQNPVAMLTNDHEVEGERFRKISELTDQYVPPAHACNTFRVCYAKLHEFEKDLHLHIHLENNVLFPRAIQLEQKGTSNN